MHGNKIMNHDNTIIYYIENDFSYGNSQILYPILYMNKMTIQSIYNELVIYVSPKFFY